MLNEFAGNYIELVALIDPNMESLVDMSPLAIPTAYNSIRSHCFDRESGHLLGSLPVCRHTDSVPILESRVQYDYNRGLGIGQSGFHGTKESR